jgi:hypothetical protein
LPLGPARPSLNAGWSACPGRSGGSAGDGIVDDACSYAWLQRIRLPSGELHFGVGCLEITRWLLGLLREAEHRGGGDSADRVGQEIHPDVSPRQQAVDDRPIATAGLNAPPDTPPTEIAPAVTVSPIPRPRRRVRRVAAALTGCP